MSKDKIIVSFSGGRTSAFMSHILIQNYKREDLFFIYANTGKEREETLDFINKCDLYFDMNLLWIEAEVYEEKGVGTSYNVVNYKKASRKGEPFDDVINKYGLPNQYAPHCTRELKEQPIKKAVKDRFGKNYKMAIGIRADERRRVNRLRAEKNKWIYPLVDDFPTTERMVLDFWKTMPFDLQLKPYEGNCDFCWKKSLKKRILISKENPHLLKWWIDHENKSEYKMDRDNLTIEEIINISKNKPLDLFSDQQNGCACFSNII